MDENGRFTRHLKPGGVTSAAGEKGKSRGVENALPNIHKTIHNFPGCAPNGCSFDVVRDAVFFDFRFNGHDSRRMSDAKTSPVSSFLAGHFVGDRALYFTCHPGTNGTASGVSLVHDLHEHQP